MIALSFRIKLLLAMMILVVGVTGATLYVTQQKVQATYLKSVLGERVNLASRLCTQAGPSQVVIDQTTKDKLGATAGVRPLPALNLKGFSENIMAYELTELHGETARANSSTD